MTREEEKIKTRIFVLTLLFCETSGFENEKFSDMVHGQIWLFLKNEVQVIPERKKSQSEI